MARAGHTAITAAQARRTAAQLAQERDAWMAAGYDGRCPVRDLLDRVGDTWTVLVLLRLGEQPMRFRALMRAVDGISQRMLTVTLRALERDGLVARKVHPTAPPAVEYRLTALGVSILEPLSALVRWALDNDATVKARRAAYERAAAVAAQRAARTHLLR